MLGKSIASAALVVALSVVLGCSARTRSGSGARADTEDRLTPSISPLRGDGFTLTSPYGNRRSPFDQSLDFHSGIDLGAPKGTSIQAPADGQVVFAGRYPKNESAGWWRYGNLVSIRHGERYITLFGHCRKIKVRRGRKVRRGQVIATVGSSGWSTSPHLHYEVRRLARDGQFHAVDPTAFIHDHRWSEAERRLLRAREAPVAPARPLPARLSRNVR